MSKSRPEARTKRETAAFGSGAWGLGGALLASLCCAPPAVAFAMGLGGSAFLVGLAQYRPFFVLAGLAVMVPVGGGCLNPSDDAGCRSVGRA